MKFVALVASVDHVCCRYRLAPFRAPLAQSGHELHLQPLPRNLFARVCLFRSLRGANVILQRTLLPRWQLALLRRWVRCLIFDFDDAVYLRDSYSPKGLQHPRNQRRFAAMLRCCDAIVAGNRYLAETAASHTTAEHIHIIPTCVEPADYAPRRSVGDGRTLVWVGSSSTLRGLEQIAPLLDRIAERFPQVRLKIICDRFPVFARMPVLRCPWDAATEPSEIAAADIGIGWVPDDLWSRGKCGLKLLQYMAAGLPVVANPVGVQADIVQPGETGWLATSNEEWLNAIGTLVDDATGRTRLGAAGRQLVEARYSVACGAAAWAEVARRVA